MTKHHHGAMPDALRSLVAVAEDCFRAYPELREICSRNLPLSDPRYPEQNLAFVAQRRDIAGLEHYSNDTIRAVLALHAVALAIRTLLDRGTEGTAIAWLTPDDALRVEYPGSRDVQPVDVAPHVFAQTIMEYAVMAREDAPLVWCTFAAYLRGPFDDTALLGLFCFRADDAVLLARSPIAIDRALGAFRDHRHEPREDPAMVGAEWGDAAPDCTLPAQHTIEGQSAVV